MATSLRILPSPRRRRVAKVLVLAAAVLICGRLFFSWLSDRLGPPFAYAFDDKPFEQSLWLRTGALDDSPRGKMADHVISRILHQGMTASQLRGLLGNPDKTYKADELYPDRDYPAGDVIYAYHLGAWSGWRVDADYLAVHFDASNRMVSAWRYQT